MCARDARACVRRLPTRPAATSVSPQPPRFTARRARGAAERPRRGVLRAAHSRARALPRASRSPAPAHTHSKHSHSLTHSHAHTAAAHFEQQQHQRRRSRARDGHAPTETQAHAAHTKGEATPLTATVRARGLFSRERAAEAAARRTHTRARATRQTGGAHTRCAGMPSDAGRRLTHIRTSEGNALGLSCAAAHSPRRAASHLRPLRRRRGRHRRDARAGARSLTRCAAAPARVADCGDCDGDDKRQVRRPRRDSAARRAALSPATHKRFNSSNHAT